jgi:hypothetical protein
MSTQPLRIRTADLGALMSGRVALLAAATLPGIEILAAAGVAVWVLSRCRDGLLVSPLGASTGGEASAASLPVTVPPAGLIALLAPTAEELQEVGEWWVKAAGQAAPVMVARDAATALPLLIRQVVEELERSISRCVQLERNLATTRQDYEETRIVMGSVSRTLGHRPPSPLTLAVALEPSPLQAGVTQPDARLFLRQPLGRKLEGLAALAVHVGMINAATSGPLRIRVFAAESARIAASWTVPMEELVEGWLVLDLPTPLGPEHEGAVLDVMADVAGPHALRFSLEEKWAPDEAACTLADGSSLGRPLALRLWTARIGDRFVVPAHWNWNEAGSSLPRTGVPQSIALAEHRAARILSGDWTWLDKADARLGVSVIGAMTAALALPRITLAGADVLRVEWSAMPLDATATAPQAVSLGVWVVDPGHHVRALDRLPPTALFSGWRSVSADGAGLLTLSLPTSLGPQAQLVLAAGSQDPAAAAEVEITRLSLVATQEPSIAQARTSDSVAPDPDATQDDARASPATMGPATIGKVELHQHLADGRGYRHLDLIVHDMAGRGHEWPRVRFKLAVNRDRPLLEFRRAAGWPDLFARWPGNQTDKFGPLLRVHSVDINAFAAALAHARDNALIATLLDLLPNIAAEGTQAGHLDVAEGAYWVDVATAMRGG